MAEICPTVTAFNAAEYSTQLQKISRVASRLHIDLMDGVFAPTKSPGLDDIWLSPGHITDIHLMYQEPMHVIKQLIALKPHMVIIHNEAHVHHMHFVAQLHKHDIKAGLALLEDTPVPYAHQIMHSFDHVLVFSGKLGYHGGRANLDLLNKVSEIKSHYPEVEIGWDGGINDKNIRQLVDAGVDVLNVGGFVQNAADPQDAYATLEARIA